MHRFDISRKIDPLHTALLVIDIQNDFCSPDGKLAHLGRDVSLMDPMIDTLERVIKIAEDSKILTIYTQQIYDRPKLNELQKEQYDFDGKLVTCDIATDGYKFYRIKPPHEAVYIKHNFNIFSNETLLATLQSHKVKTLVITGVDTQYCVETAIRNGFDLGYKIVVAEDLLATNAKNIDFHNRTLALVKKTYGVVITSEVLVSLWTR